MAKTKITIDNSLKKGAEWYNLTYQGKSLGINIKANPKTIAEIDKGSIEVELNVNPSADGSKYYGFDINEEPKYPNNKFQKLSPEELKAKQEREDHTQRMIVAQSCYAATCNLKQQSSVSHEDVLKMTKTAYDFIMNLSK